MIPVCNFEIIAKPADFYLGRMQITDYHRNPQPPHPVRSLTSNILKGCPHWMRMRYVTE